MDYAEISGLEIYRIDRDKLYSKGRQKVRTYARSVFYSIVTELQMDAPLSTDKAEKYLN